VKGFGVILAAGSSSCFGTAKQLAEVDGKPLVLHVVSAVADANLTPLVVLGYQAEAVAAVLPAEVARVENDDWAEGMGRSIATGVRAARARGAEEVVVIAADTPRVTASDLRRLVQARRETDSPMSAAEYDGVIGIPACFAANMFEELENLSEDRGARAILRAEDSAVRRVAMPHARFDVDRVDDLEGI
jgi:molybdenum cofactor cytidylyltransferase